MLRVEFLEFDLNKRLIPGPHFVVVRRFYGPVYDLSKWFSFIHFYSLILLAHSLIVVSVSGRWASRRCEDATSGFKRLRVWPDRLFEGIIYLETEELENWVAVIIVSHRIDYWS